MCSELSREKQERGKVNEKVEKDTGQEQKSFPGSSFQTHLSPGTSVRGSRALKHTSGNGVHERSPPETKAHSGSRRNGWFA